jgi:hypothetical protein
MTKIKKIIEKEIFHLCGNYNVEIDVLLSNAILEEWMFFLVLSLVIKKFLNLEIVTKKI